MKKRFPLMPIPTIIAGAALVSVIGGGAWMFDARYEKQEVAQAQYRGLQTQILQQRQDQLERRIYELQIERSRGRWSPVMERELQRLQGELQELREQIRRMQGK